jgi:hypothetical protein
VSLRDDGTEKLPDDELATRRIISDHTQSLWSAAEQFVKVVGQMKELGMSYEDIGDALWTRLPAATAVAFSQEQVAVSFGIVAESIAASATNVSGETDDERLKRQRSAWMDTFGRMPELRGVASSMSAMMDRFGARAAAAEVPVHAKLPDLEAAGRAVVRGQPARRGDGRRHHRVEQRIKGLLADGKSAPGQSPAIQCAVILRGMSTALQGALSETADGGLRMLSPSVAAPGHPLGRELVEQFFDYSDVLAVAVQRTVTLDGSSIIRS